MEINSPVSMFARIRSFALDLILFVIFFWAAGIILGLISTIFDSNTSSEHPSTILILFGIFTLIICFLVYYCLPLCSSKQATIGQRIAGIYVIEKNGEKISFSRSLIRTIVFSLTLVIPVITWIINLVIMLSSNSRVTLHDLIAGTVVVKGIPEIENDNTDQNALHKNL